MGRRFWQNPHHHVGAGGKVRQLGTQQVAQSPAHRVPGHGRADGSPHYEAGPRRHSLLELASVDMHHQTVAAGPASAPHRGREVVGPP
jgi:hypothetical protein